jgi:DNA repair protein RadA/Sms
MAKDKSVFICRECGFEHNKFFPQCKECKEIDSLDESAKSTNQNKASGYGKKSSGYAGGSTSKLVSYSSIDGAEADRYDTQIGEFNRVLGGGLVKGSVTLLAGPPGIGKSTILLQVISILSQNLKTLYVSGEESLQQIKSRGVRLKVDGEKMTFMSETNVFTIVDEAHGFKPNVMIIDSIQTMYSPESTSSPGGTTQLKESTSHLTRYAKENNVAVILVGHVTKDGTLAGPKTLEHIIDASLMIEGEDGSRFRILRAIKNRFGAVNEIGVFAMMEDGLKEIKNPSKMFLSRGEEKVSGAIVFATREGTRPMLTEIQALVTESFSEYPKRLALGLEMNRISIIIALLQKNFKLSVSNKDIYMNIVGGMKVTETASDLPVALAIVSSQKDVVIPDDYVAFGEIGLSGEIRPVPNGEDRIKESIKQGFKNIIIPKGNRPFNKLEGNYNLIEMTHIRDIMKTVKNFKPNE